MSEIRVLFIGDVVGKAGRSAVSERLGSLRSEKKIDFCIANGENAAGGLGITKAVAEELMSGGIDVLTTGNHVWDKKEILKEMDKLHGVLRPLNYPEGVPGYGSGVFKLSEGIKVGVINVAGRVFMPNLDCPFRAAKREIENLKEETQLVFVDAHAEATSEKLAMGWFLDGLATAVIGTHTHVQTADERILQNGTAYITDVGMTGAFDSVIGVKKELVLKRFLTQIPVHLEPAKRDIRISGIIVVADSKSGKSFSIERLQIPIPFNKVIS